VIALGCLGSAFYNVYSKRLLNRFSGLEVLFFSYLAATAFSLPMLTFAEGQWPQELARLHWSGWAAFGYLAVFLSGVSMVIFFQALRQVEVMVASIVEGRQIGFARVITDRVTFAYECDVYAATDCRGRGLGTWLVRCAL